MKILSIGADSAVLDSTSSAYARQRLYSERADAVQVVVVGGSKTSIEDVCLRVTGTGGNKISRYWRAWRMLRHIKNVDVITAQDPFENGVLAWLYARRSGARLHLQCHTDPFAPSFVAESPLNRIRVRIARFLLPRAQAVRCVSERARRSLLANVGVDADVLPVIPARAPQSPAVPAPFPETIVLVSRLEREKNVDVVIRALPKILQARPSAGLLILGDGSLRRGLESLAIGLGVSHRVVFAGSVSNVDARLASCHAFAQASSYEGYGLSILEAARAGVPIVTTDVGLVGEVVRHDESCLVVQQEPEAFAAALIRVLSDAELAKSLSVRARAAAEAEERTPDAYADLIVGGWKRAAAARESQGLLVFCQALDRNDLALGFFVDWIARLSEKFPGVTVAALRVGDASGIPTHVRVVSLRKEGEQGGTILARVRDAWRAIKLSWSARNKYDSVFVHMNEEYSLVAGWLWKLLGKRISMWRNHHAGTILTRIAGRICNRVFCTSKFSYTASFPNVRLMPVGVDLARYGARSDAGDGARNFKRVLFLARLDRSKYADIVIRAFVAATRDIDLADATLEIVGAPTDPASPYPDELVRLAESLGVADRVLFTGPLPAAATPEAYRRAAIFVNASSSGMYDKTIFEAFAAGCVVVASNENLRGRYDDRFIPSFGDESAFASAIAEALRLPAAERDCLVTRGRELVTENSLDALVEKLSIALCPSR